MMCIAHCALPKILLPNLGRNRALFFYEEKKHVNRELKLKSDFSEIRYKSRKKSECYIRFSIHVRTQEYLIEIYKYLKKGTILS